MESEELPSFNLDIWGGILKEELVQQVKKMEGRREKIDEANGIGFRSVERSRLEDKVFLLVIFPCYCNKQIDSIFSRSTPLWLI